MAPTELNLDEITLTPEQVAELAPLQKVSQPKPRLARAKFVQLPYEETLQAAGELQNAQLAVLVELAHLRFKTHENPVPLANKHCERPACPACPSCAPYGSWRRLD